MAYQLPTDIEQRVRAQIASGQFASADDVLREALNTFEKRQTGLRALRAMAREAEEDIAAGRVGPFHAEETKNAVQQRLQARSTPAPDLPWLLFVPSLYRDAREWFVLVEAIFRRTHPGDATEAMWDFANGIDGETRRQLDEYLGRLLDSTTKYRSAAMAEEFEKARQRICARVPAANWPCLPDEPSDPAGGVSGAPATVDPHCNFVRVHMVREYFGENLVRNVFKNAPREAPRILEECEKILDCIVKGIRESILTRFIAAAAQMEKSQLTNGFRDLAKKIPKSFDSEYQ